MNLDMTAIEKLRRVLHCEITQDGDGYFCLYSEVGVIDADDLWMLACEDHDEVEKAGLAVKEPSSDNDSYWFRIVSGDDNG